MFTDTRQHAYKGIYRELFNLVVHDVGDARAPKSDPYSPDSDDDERAIETI